MISLEKLFMEIVAEYEIKNIFFYDFELGKFRPDGDEIPIDENIKY